ncbi:MAG: dockerin type I domain-containing protein, partial [Bacteroidales bacterium]|nr:dockerin type I domain-containing protein [Bacteroidales bacterium]
GTAGVIVVARAGSAVDADPVSGTTYTANAAFGIGTQIGTGNYVVYNGTGTSVNVTALSGSTTYHYAFYEYNTTGMCYKTPALTGNATTICTPPSTQASIFTSSAITNTTMTAGWTRGNGNGGVIVVARSGSAVNADPVNGTTYAANAAFGSGTQIGTGNYVVYNGTGTSVNVSALTGSTTYHYAIYEYHTTGICYKTPGLTGNATTTCTPPGTPVSVSGSATGQNTANLSWEAGSPAGSTTVSYYWVVGTNSSVTYGNGVAQGNSTGTTASTSALSAGTTYYLRVYANTSCNNTSSGYGTSAPFATSASNVLPGDANCDGVVNVLDIVSIINIIMGSGTGQFCFGNADVNNDGSINVLDVVATINIIMGGN